ncbi:DUF475 domain-containing protein [Patescibacteria group bacterium]|nr:DUF475 domain-containing protein [Patescibacteria group bacterium]
MKKITSHPLFWSIVISLVAFVTVFFELGLSALFLVIVLSILEVTLSFDNAVINARVLEHMSPVWQRRFLTWGILVAVFGTRFILPIVIVSVAVWTSPWHITTLVFNDPAEYGRLLDSVHGAIAAFGGIFLLMVSLKYFFNKAKSVHWIQTIESHLVKWGRIEAIEIALALTTLVTLSFLTSYDQSQVLVAGITGLILFVLMEGITGTLSIESEDVVKSSASLFIYLEVLDAAFSLDGVVGAFAITNNLLIIMVGLGIGAFFVRSLTIYFVERKTLTKLKYLEHGAHWAILGLAVSMLLNLVFHIPEVFIGMIGICIVSLAYYSSLKTKKLA